MLSPELISLAQQAWEATKEESQPSWNDCQPRHRQICLTAAKAVLKTGFAQTPFEKKVAELKRQEINYALPHSEFMAEKAERVKHGDEELAEAAGVEVDQHETEGANKVGEPPKEKDVPQSDPPSLESEASPPKKANAKSPRKSKAKPKSKKGAK
jgi:hypothetical protein